MPNNPAFSKFHSAIARSLQSSARGPINASALLQDKNVAVQRAASLHGYQTYLTQCRTWKAGHKRVPRAMEHELQAQASQALADARDLATATLRMAKHLKQAGHLDRMLDGWIAGVKASGPVQLQDLWGDIANDAQARQLLRDEGLTEELFAPIGDNMKQLDGRLVLQGGKLASDVKLLSQSRTQRIALTHPASGTSKTLHDLLSRGQFEQMVEQFERGGALSFDLVEGQPRDLEIQDAISVGAILSVQALAQHKRKLEDTGLAAYAGSDPVDAFLIVGAILLVVGAIMSVVYCKEDDPHGPSGNCALAAILFILGFAAMFLAKDAQLNQLTSTPTLRVTFEQNRVDVVSVQQ
jgi:hypothetical protein